MDACTIDEDKAHPQAIILYFRSEGRASFHYSKLVMLLKATTKYGQKLNCILESITKVIKKKGTEIKTNIPP